MALLLVCQWVQVWYFATQGGAWTLDSAMSHQLARLLTDMFGWQASCSTLQLSWQGTNSLAWWFVGSRFGAGGGAAVDGHPGRRRAAVGCDAAVRLVQCGAISLTLSRSFVGCLWGTLHLRLLLCCVGVSWGLSFPRRSAAPWPMPHQIS